MDTSNQIIDRVIALLRKIEEKIAEIERLINRALAALPPGFDFIASRVQGNWNTMMKSMGDIWGMIVDFLSYAGNPAMLFGAAGGWTEIGGKVARLGDEGTDFSLSGDEHRQGKAPEQYQQSI